MLRPGSLKGSTIRFPNDYTGATLSNGEPQNVPGQSGRPGSPHYGDLLAMWAAGEYFPLAYSREAVERYAASRLLLEPSAGARK